MARFIITFFFLVAALDRAFCVTLSPLAYWQKSLPTTPIPASLRELLPTGNSLELSSKTFCFGRTVPITAPIIIVPRIVVPTITVPTFTVPVVTVPVTGGVTTGPFGYNYAVTNTQLRNLAGTALFFQEKDLALHNKLTLHFSQTKSNAKFLPRSTAESIPFSSSKLPEILSRLGLKPNTDKSTIIKNTLKRCEEKAVQGEKAFCATSLESMVDFTTSSLGSRDLNSLSTKVSKPNTPKQSYVILSSKLVGKEGVVCHALPYAYAVYYCHATTGTKSYSVSLMGVDGSKVEVVAVCHMDTSLWNPKHVAFQLLKVTPGSVPVCHFLPPDHVVWARRA